MPLKLALLLKIEESFTESQNPVVCESMILVTHLPHGRRAGCGQRERDQVPDLGTSWQGGAGRTASSLPVAD